MTQEALTPQVKGHPPYTQEQLENVRHMLARGLYNDDLAVARLLATVDSLSASLTQAREALRPVRMIVHPWAQEGIVTAHFTNDEWARLRDAAKALSTTPIQDDEYGASLAAQLREKATDG